MSSPVDVLKDVISALSHDEWVEGILTINECVELLEGLVISFD